MGSIRVVYARQKAREEVILRFCPEAPTESGIYVFYRDDVSELKFCYVGQAVNLLKRMAEHLGEYDHIGLSLKKRGFYREDNPFGWKIVFKPCPKKNLDENEKLTIKSFAEKGYQLYNLTAGGQGTGKVAINKGFRKPPKKYREGIRRGKKTLAKELSKIIDKYLEVKIRPEKEKSRPAREQYRKFLKLIDADSYDLTKDVDDE